VVKLLFLGTGTSQGVPVIGCDCEVCRSADVRDQRFRSSVALFVRDKVWVIDTGPDFRMQALRYRLPTVDAILFTHAHKDHTAGLDDVRPYNYLQNKRIPLYADALAAAQLRREFSYAFGEVNYPGVPLLDLWEIQALSPFCLHGVEVWPLPLWHYKLPILGYRVGGLAYLTDVSRIPEETWPYLEGLEVLVLSALRREPHIAHLHLEAALAVVAQLKPQRAYFTHISHLMGRHAQVELELPEGVFLAYDGLEVLVSEPA
jgi:phosphoribosyl 1,2-cyclic phosphate phosphodiesterase